MTTNKQNKTLEANIYDEVSKHIRVCGNSEGSDLCIKQHGMTDRCLVILKIMTKKLNVIYAR